MILNAKMPRSSEFLWRLLFLFGLVYTGWFFIGHYKHMTFATDLRALSPLLNGDDVLSQAIDAVATDAEKRMTLLLLADDGDALPTAKTRLLEWLAQVPEVTVLTDDVLQDHYIQGLTPYRFNLLTVNQQLSLNNKTTPELVLTEQRKLFRLAEGLRILPMERDPLGWFGDYVVTSLEQLQNLSEQTTEESKSAFESLSLVLRDDVKGMDKEQALLEQLLAMEKAIGEQFGVSILHSGLFFFAADAAKHSKADIQFIAVTSMLAIILLMLLVFRSLAPLFIAFLSIAIGVGFAVAVTYSVFGQLHVLTVVFGASLIGIVIDYSLHYFFHYFADRQSIATQQATRQLAGAMLLSVITSLIGFGALAFSDLDALKKVAVFSCCGLVMAWLTVMSLGSLVALKKFQQNNKILLGLLALLRSIFARWPKALLLSGGVAALLGGIYLGIFGVIANDDPRLFFRPSTDLLAQERTVAAYSAEFASNQFFIVAGDSVEQNYTQLSDLYAAAQTQNIQLLSLLNWLPSPQDQEQAYRLQGILYEEGGVVAQLMAKLGVPVSKVDRARQEYRDARGVSLSPLSFQQQFPQLPPFWFTAEGKQYAYVFVGKGSDMVKLPQLAADIPGVNFVNVTGFAEQALQHQRVAAMYFLMLAYVFVAVIMLAYYRRLAVVVYLAIPLSATIFTLILLPWFGQPITIFHSMALFLVLGLGMDYIVFAKEMQQHNLVTQQAILLSALTSLLSFGLLSFSSMPIVQAFGSTVLVGNLINLIATIVLFYRDNDARKETL